jgi:hypothetical protein
MQSLKGKIGRDIGHPLSEFKDFPWDKLNAEENGIGRAGIRGIDFNPYRPHIDFLYEDGYVEAWEVPEEMVLLCEKYREMGRNKLLQEFRDLLGID